MKVAFVVDYLPFIDSGVQYGGAEISITLLIDSLRNKGTNVEIVSPLALFWKKKSTLLPEWFSGSPIWVIFSTVAIYSRISKAKVDIVHVQGKNVLLGTVLANLFLKKPLIITVRDYHLLCNLGMCLLQGEKSCTPIEYLKKDIPTFIQNYTNGGPADYLYTYIVGVYQLGLRFVYGWALQRADKIVCISKAQERVFRNAGLSNTVVIYNIAKIQTNNVKRLNQVVYNGRYTKGKGKELLESIIPVFLKKHPTWKFLIVGRGETNIVHKNFQKIGHTPWKQVREIVAKSGFVVMPSVWPEPFGRSALDAITVGTPVLASNRGGLPEIVEDGRFGLVSTLDKHLFLKVMDKMVNEHMAFSKTISESSKELKEKFGTIPIQQTQDLYMSFHK